MATGYLDIFSQPKQHNPNEAPFVYPLHTEPPPGENINQSINRDVKARHQAATQDYERYIKQKYAEMDYKTNRCLYNCFEKSIEYAGMKQCKETCSRVQQKLPVYIQSSTSHMNQLLNDCLNKDVGSPQNSSNQVFRCYDAYIRGFQSLKMKIEQESRYYL